MRTKSDLSSTASSTGPGGRMLELLRGQRLVGLENSFKMSHATLLADRYLLGIHKPDISPSRLLELCTQIGMPGPYRVELMESAQTANAFHFGFEGSGTGGVGGVYKVYLEFAGRLQAGRNDPALLHLAYKWDCLNPAICTIAKYVCHPGLSAEAILDRIARLGHGRTDAIALQVASSIVRLAAGRTAEPLMYLEVNEERNPRASFDIKLHDAGLRVSDISDDLERLRLHFEISAAQFAPLHARIGGTRLGHLSGGTTRDGRSFLTVYYPPDDPR